MRRADSRGVRRVACALVGVLLIVATLIQASPAAAVAVLSTVPDFPATVTVGQTTVPASLTITNFSTPPQDSEVVFLSEIRLVPSCGSPTTAATNCPTADVDPGVFTLSATGIGRAGTACAGMTFNTSLIDSAQGKYEFTPVGSPVVLGTPASGAASASCAIDFTFTVARAPAVDAQPASPGLQTTQVASATGTSGNTGFVTSSVGTDSVTVSAATATLTTQATPTATLGEPISDTATVAGVSGSPAPTGTISFSLYGPDDATCSGPQVFASTQPLGSGSSPTASSGNVTPTATGTYRWIATYSGDANYLPATAPCNAPDETSTVTAASATVTTQATPTATLGQPISDTATVSGISGGPVPTGTVTFAAYGPNDATCAGAAAFTSSAQPLGGGPPPTASSGNFTPSAAGTYRWIASYSGDVNYSPVTTSCNDANETSTVSAPPAAADCAITSLSFSSAWVHEKQSQVKVVGRNAGTVQARCRITLAVRRISPRNGPSAPLYPARWIRTAAPGGVFTVYFEVTPPVPGTYRVTACVRAINSSGTVIDSDAANNCRTAQRTAT